MTSQFAIPEGTTGPFFFQLLDNGVPIDITDFTVTLRLTDVTGTDLVTSADLTITQNGAVNGVVKYAPTATELVATGSPLKARWKLVEDTGAVYFVPIGYRDEWDVVPA